VRSQRLARVYLNVDTGNFNMMFGALLFVVAVGSAAVVRTPFGDRPSECVVEVPSGAMVDQDSVAGKLLGTERVVMLHCMGLASTHLIVLLSVLTPRVASIVVVCSEPP
jgi:hypothetical protein